MSLNTTQVRRWRSATVALLTGSCFVALFAVFPSTTVDRWREAAIDAELSVSSPPWSDRVAVVEIDRRSLALVGRWPWSRGRMADLIAAIARAAPACVAVDVVLGEESRDPASSPGMPQTPAGDADLASVLDAVPVDLGFLVADEPVHGLGAGPEILVKGTDARLSPWRYPGAILPAAALRAGAAGLGVSSLNPGAAGLVRSVPLFALVGDTLMPGFAAEAVRLSEQAASYVVQTASNAVTIGDARVPLQPGAEIRIRPSSSGAWAGRTVSAADVLSGDVDPKRFAGRVVLVGGRPPALGDLWKTAASAAAPSVQIQADAVETALSAHIPERPGWAGAAEAAGAVVLSVLAGLSAAELPPLVALAIALAGAAAYAAGAAAALAYADLVIDPLTPPLAAVAVGIAVELVTLSETRLAARRLRRRFGQHLSPDIVHRIAERTGAERLAAERRDITALFTDLEGFTDLTERVEPVAFIALLDRYFELVSGIVAEHGGVVDKIVGDAVHAMFNAASDLPDHPRRAVACALAIVEATRRFAAKPENDHVALGRTRIGIETGMVIVAEVGGGSKLDYTAHGSAVNTASRLEELNKRLGSSICVGPVCRERVGAWAEFRDLGLVDVRGRGPLPLFEPVAAREPATLHPPSPEQAPVSRGRKGWLHGRGRPAKA